MQMLGFPMSTYIHRIDIVVCRRMSAPGRLFTTATLVLSQARPHVCPTSFPEFLRIFSPNFGGLNIGGTFVVWAAQHANYAHEDCFGCLDWRPTLRRVLVTIWIVGRSVKD